MSVAKAFCCVIFIIFLPILSLAGGDVQEEPEVLKGELNISDYNIRDLGTIDLDGEWEFYYNRLLSPQDFKDGLNNNMELIHVPSIWNDILYKGIKLGGQGYATYRLTVHKKERDQLLAFFIPNVYTSYKLYVNDSLVAQNGEVGESKDKSSPSWKPLYKTFICKDSKMEIIWQVSNFYHNRGGIHKVLKFGSPESVAFTREKSVISNILSVGGLIVLGLFFIIFFFIRKGQTATLYFGLLCILWALRALFSNIYLITDLMPGITWNAAIRIEYLSLYASVLAGVLFITKTYGEFFNPLFKWIIITINYLFIALSLILPPLFFTSMLPAYQFFLAVNLAYIVLIIVRAIMDKQKEAWFSAASIFIGISLFTYEITAYIFIFKVNHVLINIGYLAIFFLNSLVIAAHFVSAIHKMKNLEEEKENETLSRLGRTYRYR
ncbi:7TM-DISM domain-containing protein [Fulvivirga ligni]|uniref:7TM-DISM domain-containing protein n=1 Tax=Fulvivirga ligni TaxID=2904246 RepID=UPI001F328BF8|nr:7TM-DISM domain-containing protein [Fulvivirga ligni]UII22543.1 7TM-DISM domain-containing protein [Fulvivirga ligni]